jgi:hypothetical protein
MTHDELLDRIAQEGLKPYGNVMNTNLTLALRAVVELHKPAFTIVDGVKGVEWCYQCADQRGYAKYPCPTIQAIEEQLK